MFPGPNVSRFGNGVVESQDMSGKFNITCYNSTIIIIVFLLFPKDIIFSIMLICTIIRQLYIYIYIHINKYNVYINCRRQ